MKNFSLLSLVQIDPTATNAFLRNQNVHPLKVSGIIPAALRMDEADTFEDIKKVIDTLYPKVEVSLLLLVNNKENIGYTYKAIGGLMHIMPIIFMVCSEYSMMELPLLVVKDKRHTMPALSVKKKPVELSNMLNGFLLSYSEAGIPASFFY